MPTGKSTKRPAAKSGGEFQPVFERLRSILKKHGTGFHVMRDGPAEYGFGGPPGPGAIKAWKGKVRQKEIMVTWLKVGKGYVSYHLLGVYMNPKLLGTISKELKARMQGLACFNFKKIDEPLFKELDRITRDSLAAMKQGEFIA